MANTLLRHTYFLIRHGVSQANVAQVVACKPTDASGFFYGLAPEGRAQAARAADDVRALAPPSLDLAQALVFSSDFARCAETADAVRGSLGLPEKAMWLRAELRERDFGDLDLGPDDVYDEVWAADHQRKVYRQCESPPAVAARAMGLLEEIEDAHDGPRPVVICGHGDLLQILLASVHGHDPWSHRTVVDHMAQCEVRRVDANSSSR